MTVYFLVYLCGFIFSFCYSFAKNKYVVCMYKILTFLTLALPACLRYKIGTDYENYTGAIVNGFSQGKYDIFEAGWIPVLWFIDKFGFDLQFFFIFVSLCTYFIVFKYIERPYFYLCVPVYICTAYLDSYSLVRQSFACTIFLLCIMSFQDRKYFRAILWGAVSFLFHKSTIILCLLLPLSSMQWKIFSSYKNAVLFLLIYFLFDFFNFAQIVMEKIVGNTFYAVYVNSGFNRQTEIGTGLGLLLRICIIFIFVFVSSRQLNVKNDFCDKDRKTSSLLLQEKNYKLICICMFSFLAFALMAKRIHIFNRLMNLMSLSYLLSVQTMAKSKNRYRKFALLFVIIALSVLFFKDLQSNPSSAAGGLGLTPYRSIFSR